MSLTSRGRTLIEVKRDGTLAGNTTTTAQKVPLGTPPVDLSTTVLESTYKPENINEGSLVTKLLDSTPIEYSTKVDSTTGIIVDISRQAVPRPAIVVHAFEITNGGTGYSSGSPPVVTVSGGSGSGATGTAVVSGGGVVIGIIVTAAGTGYDDQPPTVSIAAPGSGTTATASARTGPQDGGLTASTGTLIEYEEWNKQISIKITSKVRYSSLPPTTSWTGVVRISLPPILQNAGVVQAYAFAADIQRISAGFYYNIKEGYTGPAAATFTRYYTLGPNSALPPVTTFSPQSDQLVWYWYYFSTDGPSGNIADARTEIFRLPATLHEAITISGTANTALISPATISGTSPTGWSSNQQIVHAVEPKPLPLGIYETIVIVATIP